MLPDTARCPAQPGRVVSAARSAGETSEASWGGAPASPKGEPLSRFRGSLPIEIKDAVVLPLPPLS